MFLNIHLNGCSDNGRNLEILAGANIPFGISLVPVLLTPEHEVFKNGVYETSQCYSQRVIEILKQVGKRRDIVFGQQGMEDYCFDCFQERDKKDPYHENSCLYKKSRGSKEQEKFMRAGRTLIEDRIGVSPRIYVPPGHQFDEASLDATRELGYKYFAERAAFELEPYKDEGQNVLPEREIGESGKIFYILYDQINNNLAKFNETIRELLPIEEIKFSEGFSLDKWGSRVLTKFRKIRVDDKKENTGLGS